MRICGKIGNWPVDLELKLNGEEVRLLAALLGAPAGVVAEPVAAPPTAPVVVASGPGERVWQLAQECLRRSGEVEGPRLLADLSALAGSEQEGKRLLVRLRHLPQVVMESRGATSIYRWSDQ